MGSTELEDTGWGRRGTERGQPVRTLCEGSPLATPPPSPGMARPQGACCFSSAPSICWGGP